MDAVLVCFLAAVVLQKRTEPENLPAQSENGSQTQAGDKASASPRTLKTSRASKGKDARTLCSNIDGKLSSVRTQPTCAYTKHTRARACGRARTETIPRQTQQMPEAVQSKQGWRNACCNGGGVHFFAALLIISIHWSKSVSGNMLLMSTRGIQSYRCHNSSSWREGLPTFCKYT